MSKSRRISISAALATLATTVLTGCATSPANAQATTPPATDKKPNILVI